MAASGDSVAASRPSPGGGGLAWLTGKFIAPDALRPQWPTNQRGGGGRREHDPPATRTVAKGGAQVPPAWTWGGWTRPSGASRSSPGGGVEHWWFGRGCGGAVTLRPPGLWR